MKFTQAIDRYNAEKFDKKPYLRINIILNILSHLLVAFHCMKLTSINFGHLFIIEEWRKLKTPRSIGN